MLVHLTGYEHWIIDGRVFLLLSVLQFMFFCVIIMCIIFTYKLMSRLTYLADRMVHCAFAYDNTRFIMNGSVFYYYV